MPCKVTILFKPNINGKTVNQLKYARFVKQKVRGNRKHLSGSYLNSRFLHYNVHLLKLYLGTAFSIK